MFRLIAITLISFHLPVYASSPDWSASAELPGKATCEIIHGHEVCLTKQNRKNIYNLSDRDLEEASIRGAGHALNYPVDVTRLKLPTESMEKFFNSDADSPLRKFIFKIAYKLTKFKSFDDIFKWMGLHEYPKSTYEEGPNRIPEIHELEEYRMGVSLYHSEENYRSMSFSCAACHSADLFGVKVLGLTNRFPKANETFILGKKLLGSTPSILFKTLVDPSSHDLELFKEAKSAMKYVELKKPLVLGLDTSLAQVGLSLSLRAEDEYATMKPFRRARTNQLRKVPGDSKPAVWWNLKYKTRWLSDGSIESGNPVHTNFLWNEIGRGVDLKELEKWLTNNKNVVKDLTAFTFNTEAPLYDDFFPKDINIEMAIKGEKHFLKSCKGCHGVYDKGWSDQNSESLSYKENIATTNVWYHKKSKIVDIGTDPYRHQGMKYFAKDLNRLKISKTIGTQVTPQKGYIPPPLVGIWSRWPYFHNNSAPTLYDVISIPKNRTQKYAAVAAADKQLDFDKERNGYPPIAKVREEFRNNSDYIFDTKIKGLSNRGHRKMLVDENDKEILNHTQKLELIEFLKTL